MITSTSGSSRRERINESPRWMAQIARNLTDVINGIESINGIELLYQCDGAICSARHHVNVVCLNDEFGLGIALLPRHNFIELRIVVGRFKAFVALFFRGVTAHINECVCRVDTKLRVALEWNPVADIGNSVTRVDRRGTAGEACRERVPFSRLRRVNAQLVKTGNVSLLSAAPFDSGKAERKT